MSPAVDAFLRSWPFDPMLLAGLALTGGIYLRGWLALRWRLGRLCAFTGGLTIIYLALSSPIEPFASLLLQVHMVQHMLLMMAAPPLLWLGAPLFPLLRGLPRPVRTYWAAPLVRSAAMQRVFSRLTHPATALPLFAAATWVWHVPAAYERALTSSGWHYFQHLCFLAAGMLFWYPVVRPFPSRPRWSLWLLVPYLILADVQSTVLSALLTFSDRVLYPYYLQIPRLGRLSVLEDQAAAGVIMWVPGSLTFLLPLFGIGIRLLYGRELDTETRRHGDKEATPNPLGRIPLPMIGSPRGSVSLSPRLPVSTSSFDLLRVPLLGRFLQWRHARLVMQLPLLALAGVVILDGLSGPNVGPMNLAGVLPWIHWRGLLILGLLAAGNVFCMACPFMLPRTLARRWLPLILQGGRPWPRWLRSKWLAVALLTLFLWSYEAFSLWDSPWWTAWIAVGYFISALVVDGFFRGAAFCKYLCPIGQFNFVQSLISPLEITVRDPQVCTTCQTKDCIRGREEVPGCELHLFQPAKNGNMDCTFCLDCIHACPHGNIAVSAGMPGQSLWQEKTAASGHWPLTTAPRPDLAALVVLLVFGAFANAAGMVGPVRTWQQQLGSLLGEPSPLFLTSLFYLFALLVAPLLLVGGAAELSRRWGKLTANWLMTATRFSFALVPLGFSMWLAHYSFHLLTSYDTVVPTAQRFAAEHGWTVLGEPNWDATCCRPVTGWLPRLEILFLDLGLLLSLYTGYRIAMGSANSQSVGQVSNLPSEAAGWKPAPRVHMQSLKAFAPWALLIVVLFAAGVWLVLQPMQMRGTLAA